MRNLIFVLVIFVSTCINAVSNEIITEIQDHWNKIDTMSGQFRQEDSDGTISHGNFYFLKPYRSKFIYHDKAENVITNESLLVIVDNDDRKIESYSIGNNVLKNLLSNELLIKQQFDLVNFHISDDQYVDSASTQAVRSGISAQVKKENRQMVDPYFAALNMRELNNQFAFVDDPLLSKEEREQGIRDGLMQLEQAIGERALSEGYRMSDNTPNISPVLLDQLEEFRSSLLSRLYPSSPTGVTTPVGLGI